MSLVPIKEITITNPDSRAFDQFFAIYEEALPAGERKPRESIASLTQRGDYSILGLTLHDEVVGFSIVFASETETVGLLEYMATKKSVRNSGLGARLFKMSLAQMADRAMLVEVDSEREAASDLPLRVRRKNFYLRLGCKQVEGLDYILPVVSDEPPPVLDLLYYSGTRPLSVEESTLRTWLQTLYVEVYQRNPDDVSIDLMLRQRREVMCGCDENV